MGWGVREDGIMRRMRGRLRVGNKRLRGRGLRLMRGKTGVMRGKNKGGIKED